MLLFRTFSAPFKIFFVTRGDALRAGPWLSYSAPSALAAGFHIPRLRRWLSYSAPSTLAPGFHIPRLRRWLSYSAPSALKFARRELFVAERDEWIHLGSFSRREETGQQRNHPEDHRNDHEDGDVERAHSEQETS